MFEHENILYDKLPALEAKSMTKLDESESGIMVLERWFNHIKNYVGPQVDNGRQETETLSLDPSEGT